MRISFLRLGLAALTSTFLLSSCVAMVFARFPHKVPFNEADFARYGAPGTATIRSVLMYNYYGEIEYADGSPVTLLPVTPYTKEMIDREIGDGVTLLPSDSRLKKYIHIGHTDGHGNFTFSQVPAGEYFVAGEIEWTYDGENNFYRWGCERVTVGQGQTVQVKFTHDPVRGQVVNNIWTIE
jgi:hypothetical protein